MRVLGWVLAAILIALPLVAHAQTEAVFSLGRFVFEDGGEIPDMKVGYVIWGTECGEEQRDPAGARNQRQSAQL